MSAIPLPIRVDPRQSAADITEAPAPEPVTASLYARYPAAHIEAAQRKLFWLHKWRLPPTGGDSGGARAAKIIAEAKAAEGADFRISLRSLQLWDRRERRDGLEALIPRYNGPRKNDEWRIANSELPPSSGGGRGGARAAAAIDWFYTLYHAQNRPSAADCHEATVREAQHQGWSWPASYTATVQWLDKYDDRSLTYLMRHGKRAWAHRYMPYLEQDWNALEPGEMYVADHHQVDFSVDYKGKTIRPWLTAIEDCRSRVIVGWHLGPSPNQDAIIKALRGAFRDWAIPRVMRFDNGRDFTSQLITGLTRREMRALRAEYGADWKKIVRRDRNLVFCDDPRWLGITGELGIELIYAIPYAPWSKGLVERFFGTFEERCGKTIGTYSGNCAANKPDGLPRILGGADIPKFALTRDRVAEFIELYHHRAHRGLGGAPPMAVWQTAARLRRAEENALLCLMDTRGLLKVTANGVAITVGGARLTYGASSSALKRWVGRQVLVMLDPDHLTECWALEPDTRRLIARLEPNERMHPCATGQDAREAIGAMQRERKVMRQATRSAADRTRTMVGRMNRDRQRQLAELRKTGTDDGPSTANLVPVQTGFEGLSISPPAGGTRGGRSEPRQSWSGPPRDEYDDLDDVSDLFAPPAPRCPEDDEEDLSDLFACPTAADELTDDGLEGLL